MVRDSCAERLVGIASHAKNASLCRLSPSIARCFEGFPGVSAAEMLVHVDEPRNHRLAACLDHGGVGVKPLAFAGPRDLDDAVPCARRYRPERREIRVSSTA